MRYQFNFRVVWQNLDFLLEGAWLTKNIELKFVIRLSPAHMAVRQGEPDLLRWLDTFIFFHKLNGNVGKLHEKWFNEKMQALPTF